MTPETTLQNGDIIGRRDLWPTFPTDRNDCSGSGPVHAAASLMRTGYFIVGSPVRAPEGLEAALGDEAVRFRRRPGWLPPVSAPHPVEGLHAAWELFARWMHRASGVKKGILDSFMIVVVLSPVENLRTVVLDAVRNFGAANTLLAIVDSEMCEQGWYEEAAATAGSCGSRATLVTVSGAGSKR